MLRLQLLPSTIPILLRHQFPHGAIIFNIQWRQILNMLFKNLSLLNFSLFIGARESNLFGSWFCVNLGISFDEVFLFVFSILLYLRGLFVLLNETMVVVFLAPIGYAISYIHCSIYPLLLNIHLENRINLIRITLCLLLRLLQKYILWR